ncbi:hypothetical protein SETIT_9G422200v2 [Setaria italica]|uniref:Uncharacterized protein n=1 Tax=Setaria italica TaxID=4555 RepID=A0A368SRK4_SETIT|nr:hypothetical protein SETIT_9G422200v2 [Setaria italica]
MRNFKSYQYQTPINNTKADATISTHEAAVNTQCNNLFPHSREATPSSHFIHHLCAPKKNFGSKEFIRGLKVIRSFLNQVILRVTKVTKHMTQVAPTYFAYFV